MIVETKQGQREIGNGVTVADGLRTNPITGEVYFTDHRGVTRTLRPTFEAVLEIEDKLGAVDGLRTKFSVAGLNPELTPTTREYGFILLAGLKAAGETGISLDAATRYAYDCGRAKLRGPLLEFLWACSDGGRGRATDLKNVASSTASPTAQADDASTVVEDLIDRMEQQPNRPSEDF